MWHLLLVTLECITQYTRVSTGARVCDMRELIEFSPWSALLNPLDIGVNISQLYRVV